MVQQITTPANRMLALDALRGLAVALMILVNTPGSWSYVYSPFLHAPWHGFTLADWVFPLFLFAVGSAMAFSMQNASPGLALYIRIAKRTLMIFGCGLLLHSFPFTTSLTELRIPGVLQRIALCYGIAAVLVTLLTQRKLWWCSVLILPLYWLVLTVFSTDGAASLSGNAVQQVDLWLFGATHLYQGFGEPFDPEGVLSTLPAVSSVLLGYLFTLQVRPLAQPQACKLLLRYGVLLVVIGLLWHQVWPINKPLWSGSYVLFATGLTLLLLAFLVFTLDIKQQHWPTGLVHFGANPLFIYMLSWLWAVSASRLLVWQQGERNMSLYQWGYEQLAIVLPAELASLVFAVLHVLLFWSLAFWLYQRRVFIKI
ncbi:acyltransferase family protein [Alishewanella longhuensis]